MKDEKTEKTAKDNFTGENESLVDFTDTNEDAPPCLCNSLRKTE